MNSGQSSALRGRLRCPKTTVNFLSPCCDSVDLCGLPFLNELSRPFCSIWRVETCILAFGFRFKEHVSFSFNICTARLSPSKQPSAQRREELFPTSDGFLSSQWRVEVRGQKRTFSQGLLPMVEFSILHFADSRFDPRREGHGSVRSPTQTVQTCSVVVFCFFPAGLWPRKPGRPASV